MYRALDRERGIPVALKVLRRVDPAGLYRFKHEFRALADVTHPNLVTLYELLSVEDEWFFTMEYLVGSDLITFVRGGNPSFAESEATTNALAERLARADATSHDLATPATADTVSGNAPGEPSPSAPHGPASDQLRDPEQLARLRTAFTQLAEGVMALHRAGHLHRDIKPSNVIVSPEGRLVVLDFGLITELTQRHVVSRRVVIGTPAYMAPEQAAGESNLSEAADWYAVGVVLYMALTGDLPFSGERSQILHAKQTTAPPVPRGLSPEIPRELIDVCMRLLERAPAARPGGRELLDALGTKPRVRARRPASITSNHVGLVGREEHLSTLAQALEQVAAGRQWTVLVNGESGMGKTALCRQFLDTLHVMGTATVLDGRCYERESVPYKALDSLVDGVCRHLLAMDEADLAKLIPPGAPALARLFPVLRRVKPIHEAALTEEIAGRDPHQHRRRGVSALRALFSSLAAERPLVLAIDDAQWGDLDSAELLAEVLAPPSPCLLLLLSFREEEREHSAFLRSFTDALGRNARGAPAVTELPVGRLSPEDARRLAEALLPGGRDPTRSDRAGAIARESDGNPFFVRELVNYVANARVVVPHRLSLEDVVAIRLGQLSDGERRLLDIVALAGGPTSQRVALAAADLGVTGQTALLSLERGHLVKSYGPRSTDPIEPYHDRIREVTVARVAENDRLRLHAELARQLEAHREGDAETLAVHWRHAGEAERAGRYFETAARLATDALAFDRAAALYRQALAMRTSGPEPADPELTPSRLLRVRLAEAVACAGRSTEAAGLFSEAATEATATERIDLERRAAENWLISGHQEQGRAAIERLLAEVGARMPATPRRALASYAYRQALLRVRGLRVPLRDESDVPPEELRRIDIFKTVSHGLSMFDPIAGLDFQGRALLASLRAREPMRLGRSLAMEAASVATQGGRHLKRARHLLEEARRIATGIEHPYLLAWVAAADALLTYFSGRFGDAFDRLTRAEAQFLRASVDTTWERSTLRIYRVYALSLEGSFLAAGGLRAEAVRDARDRGDRYLEHLMTLEHGPSLFCDGTDAVVNALDRAEALSSQLRFSLPDHQELLARGELALHEGTATAAVPALMPRFDAVEASMLKHIQLVRSDTAFVRARLLLAGAAQSVERRRGWLREVRALANRLMREQICHATANAHLILAGVAALGGDTVATRQHLTRGLEVSQQAGLRAQTAVASHRLAELADSDGDEHRERADSYFADERIRDRDRFVAVWSPGFPDRALVSLATPGQAVSPAAAG